MPTNETIFIIDNELFTEVLRNTLNVYDIFTHANTIYIDGEYKYDGYKHYKHNVLIRMEININDIYLEDVIINVGDLNNMNSYRYGYNIKNNRFYYFTGGFYINENEFNLYGYEYTFRHIINTIQTFDKLMKAGIITIESPSPLFSN